MLVPFRFLKLNSKLVAFNYTSLLCFFLFAVLFTGIGLGIYWGVLGPFPYTWGKIQILQTPVLIFSVVLLGMRFRPWGGLGVLCLLWLFLGLMALSWSEYLWSGMSIGSSLFFTDPSGYIEGAEQLSRGGTLNDYASTRPIAHCFLSSIIWLSQHNLAIANIIYVCLHVLLLSLACFVLNRRIGLIGTVFFALHYFWFIRPYTGSFLSEHFGLMMGTLSVLFITGMGDKITRRAIVLFAFTLTVALMARAGAFFVLPCMACSIFLLSDKDLKWRVHTFILYSLAVFLGFLLHFCLIKTVASAGGESFSNFVYSLHGLVFNQSWVEAFESQKTIAVLWGEIFESVIQNPLLLLKGVFRAWSEYYIEMVEWSFWRYPTWLKRFLQLTVLLGLFVNLRNWRKGHQLWAIGFLLGVFLSVPFVPPWDAGIRPYAATIPIQAYLSALGIMFIVNGPIQKVLSFLPKGRIRHFLEDVAIALGMRTGFKEDFFPKNIGIIKYYFVSLFVLLFLSVFVPLMLRVQNDEKDEPLGHLIDDSYGVLLKEGSFIEIYPDLNGYRDSASLVELREYQHYFTWVFPQESKALDLLPKKAIITNNFKANTVYILKHLSVVEDPKYTIISAEEIQVGGLRLILDKSLAEYEYMSERLKLLSLEKK